MKKIAIIGSGEMAVILVENAKKINLETHTFSNNMHDRVVGYSDYHHDISIFDVDKIVDCCTEINCCGVLPTTELTVSIAAIVAFKLGLHGMPVDVATAVTDKGYVRNKIKTLTDIKQPDYCIWTVGDAIPQIDNFPVVVKPTAMGGKRGVSVAYSPEDLKNAIEYSVDNMSANKTRVIIEGFVGGDEYSVESLSYESNHMVIQITEKITSGPPHCVELGHLQPAGLSHQIKEKIECVVPKLLSAVGVDNTTTHTEIKVWNNQIYLIELNARSGGDHIAYPLTELSTGYPYIQGAIQVAMGNFVFPNRETFNKNCCGVIFVAKQTKRFEALFHECENYYWLYKKNLVTDTLQEIINNNAFDTNYFIFRSKFSIPTKIDSLLREQGDL